MLNDLRDLINPVTMLDYILIMMTFSLFVWLVVLIVMIVKDCTKKEIGNKKRKNTAFYYLEYLLNRDITTTTLWAYMVDMHFSDKIVIDSKKIKLGKNKDYSELDNLIIEWLFADKKNVSINDLEKLALSNYNQYSAHYYKFKNQVMDLANKEDFYINNDEIRKNGLLFSALGFLYFFICSIFKISNFTIYIFLVASIIGMLYYLFDIKYSANGKKELKRLYQAGKVIKLDNILELIILQKDNLLKDDSLKDIYEFKTHFFKILDDSINNTKYEFSNKKEKKDAPK